MHHIAFICHCFDDMCLLGIYHHLGSQIISSEEIVFSDIIRE